MAVSDKTRKVLWGRSGNRCAICRRLLVMNATDSDTESVIGDECHIVAHEPDGPRGDSSLTAEERDNYPNLILLCKVHHKLVDDQPNTYPVERLEEIKRRHEIWVRETLKVEGKTSQSSSKPFVAYRIETGKQLLSTLGGSHASLFDNCALESEFETELVGDFLQGAQEYIELWEELESRERVRAQFELDKAIRDLEEKGFLVYGCQRTGKYRAGDLVVDDWRVAYLIVKRKSDPVVAKKSAEVENLVGMKNLPNSGFSNFILVKHE